MPLPEIARLHLQQAQAFVETTRSRWIWKWIRIKRRSINVDSVEPPPTASPTTATTPRPASHRYASVTAVAAKSREAMQRDIGVNIDVDSKPIAASLLEAIELCQRRVWHVEKMRPMQVACLVATFSERNTKKSLALTSNRHRRSSRQLGPSRSGRSGSGSEGSADPSP